MVGADIWMSHTMQCLHPDVCMHVCIYTCIHNSVETDQVIWVNWVKFIGNDDIWMLNNASWCSPAFCGPHPLEWIIVCQSSCSHTHLSICRYEQIRIFAGLGRAMPTNKWQMAGA